MTQAPVVRAVTVPGGADRAFAIFTRRIGDWWPLATHSPADSLSAGLAFVDGRLVETLTTGDSTVWGTVTEWEPPRRIAFTWHPGGGPETTVAVDFEEAAEHTRVVLTHTGWEAYGDAAVGARDSYDGVFAWVWVLHLFTLATAPPAAGAERPRTDTPFDVRPLRAGYEAVAEALDPGAFGEPPAGEWNARQVAGHVITNAELMSQVVDDVRRGAPARLHGPDDHAASAVGRCDGIDYTEVADQVRRAGAELVARCGRLTTAELDTPVSTYIEHHGTPDVDGPLSVADLLAAEVHRHLPAHADQIRDLTAPADADARSDSGPGGTGGGAPLA